MVYLLLLTTESGDDYHWVFNARPTTEQVFDIFKRDVPDELGEALGTPEDRWGYCQSWRIDEAAIESLPA